MTDNIATTELNLVRNNHRQIDYQQEALAWQAAGQKQVLADIAIIKSTGQPIYYTQNGKLIREDANGQKFHYQPQPDGSDLIIERIN